MKLFKVNLTSDNLANNLNDIVAKCNELATEFGLLPDLNPNIKNGQPLSAGLLNAIIEFLNYIASNNSGFEDRINYRYKCEDLVCDLDAIIDFINKLIKLLNPLEEVISDDVYDLVIVGEYPKYVSNSGDEYLVKAYITKNGRIYSNDLTASYNGGEPINEFNITKLTKYILVKVAIPENNTESLKTYTINFTDLIEELDLSKSIDFILNGKELKDPIEETLYGLSAVVKESGLRFYVVPSNKTLFTLKVLATINGVPTKEGISCRWRYDLSLPPEEFYDINLAEIDNYSDSNYIYYKYECAQYLKERIIYCDITFLDLEETLTLLWKDLTTLENIRIEAYSPRTELEADDTEADITSDVFINDKSVDNDAIIQILEGNGEVVSSMSLYDGKRLSTMSIPVNYDPEPKEYVVRAVYTKDNTLYFSNSVTFVQKGRVGKYSIYATPIVLYIIQGKEDGSYNVVFLGWQSGDSPWTLYVDNSSIATYSNVNNITQTISSNLEVGGPYSKNIKVVCDGKDYYSSISYYIVAVEFKEVLNVTPSNTTIKVGDTVEFTITSNSYQQAYELAKTKFPESIEPYYNLRVEGDTMSILETDESIDIADSRNIKTAGYFIAPYNKLNAYTSVPSQIKYSLKAIGEGSTKVTFASHYGQGDYVGASTSCTINVLKEDPKYQLICTPNVVELKVGGSPAQVRLTLEGWEHPKGWELRWDNYISSIGVGYDDCVIYPASTESIHEKLFTATVDGKEYTATLIVITHAEEDPVGNLHHVIYWDVGNADEHSTRYDYYTNPDAIALGRTYFYSGDDIHTYQWMTEREAKDNALARGRDRSNYTLRGWDRDAYTKMPDWDFSVGAIWDEGQTPPPEPEEPNTYSITWSGSNFTMTDMSPVISNGDSLEEGSTWTGKVTPSNGYEITNITVVGATRDSNKITVTNLDRNVTINVVTSPILYSISWSGQHISTSNMSPTVSNGGKLNLNSTWATTFVPDEGYQIDNITYTGLNITKTGNRISVSSLRSNVNIVITTSEIPPNLYTITWNGEHVSIPGVTSPVTLNEGSSWSGTFIPEDGHQIDSITYEGQNVSKSGNMITVSNLLSDVTITISTSEIPANSYVISWTGEHASVNKTLPVTLEEHSQWSGTFTADEGYKIDSIKVNGQSLSGNTVTILDLTGNINIVVTTSKIRYTISWNGSNVSISDNSTSPITKDYGSSWSGTFVASEGYEITNILTSGSNVTKSGNTVNVSNLTSNISINITTDRIVIPKYSITWSGEHISMINMNPVISNGGEVDYGSNWTGTVEVDDGYLIDNILTSKGIVSENTISISNITENVNINITVSEIIPITLSVSDAKVRIGETEYLFTKWSLSDSNYQVDTVQYSIADTSLAEVTGNEGWEEVLGKVKGETTFTVTINGTITGTANLTVIGILEEIDSSLFTNRIPTFDIFGNRARFINGYRSAIPTNNPNGDYSDVIVYNDGQNDLKFVIPTNSAEELQYIIDNMEVTEDWLTVTNSGYSLVVNLEPWYDKIEELKNYAHYDSIVGSNVVVGIFNPPNHSSFNVNIGSGDNNHRIANIILTASDGTLLTIPVVLSCVYGGDSIGGGDSFIIMNVSSENIWKSVDWYGLEGTTLSERPGTSGWQFDISISGGEHAFAVFHPYESVQGITGLPDLVVLDYNDTPYDSSYSILYTHIME